MSARTLHLGYMYWANGTHPAGWRRPGAEYSRAFDPDYIAGLARIAEAAKFDFFFFGDRLATGVEYELTNTSVLARIEPFTTAAYLATLTSRIGLVVTANPTYYEPFTLARLTASLDHISRGRASWNIVTGADGRAAQNYSREQHGDATERYDRADEFVGLVRGLWDSWEDDAFIRDKETGVFVDATKIHRVDHEGAAFHVRGPLNVARPPQGHPVVLHAGTSERSRQLAGREADVLFAAAATVEQGISYRADIRRRAEEAGRDPATIAVLPGLTPIVAETTERARQLYDELNALILLDDDVRLGGREPEEWAYSETLGRREDYGPGLRNLGALSQRIGYDATVHGLDDAVTAEAAATFGPVGRQLVGTVARRTGRTVSGDDPTTWRDLLYAHIVAGHVIVGGPAEIADYIEEWFVSEASDGFNIQSAFLVQQLHAFVDLVVPELQRRGLFRTDYDGATLRDHLGLERPENRWTNAGTVSEPSETPTAARA
ncbi:NtaA/DmoA family FMN-dependent monooxygenase [Agromyces sp. NPDC056523]|uniref:NtaA/DmoA family FMN-dependent monooxygenase n=1 Tax=Agromyces sp. NPDC056523 TaxID=3345850 RepID=UPI0036725A4D